MVGFEGAVVLSKALKTNTTLSKITLDGDSKDTFIEKKNFWNEEPRKQQGMELELMEQRCFVRH